MASAQSQPNGYMGQQPQPGSPERQSSFVGLPPIRRTSTFGLLGKDGDSDSIASDKDNIPPVPPMPQYIASQGTGEQPPNRFGSPGPGPSQQQQGPPPQLQQQQFQQHQLQQQQHQQFMQQGPPQHYTNGGQPGGPQMGPPNGMPPNGFQAGRGFGGPAGPGAPGGPQMQQQQQPGFGRGGPPGMPGQPFPPQAGGNPIAQFPMGGKWKLEESHLQQPLNQPKNNRSSPQLPQPGYFAGDKETESQLALSPGANMLQRRNNSGMPPISAQRWPSLFQEQGQAGPQGQPGQMGPPGQPIQPGQFMQQGPPQQQQQPFEPNKNTLTRTSTNEIQEGEKGHGRKLSSGLMSKFSRARASSNAEDQSSVHQVGANDASSIISAETESGKKEGFFGSLTRRSTAALDQMKSSPAAPQQQQQQPQQIQQQQPQQQAPERRSTSFFGGGNQPQGQSMPKSSLNLVRTATQESAAPSQAPQQSSGKKRLSSLVSGFGDRIKNVGSSKEDDQPAKSSPGLQQGGQNGQFPPGQQPPAGARLGPGAPGVPGQGPPGPQGPGGPQAQQRLMQGSAPGQQFPPGQGPPVNMMGSRGPPGWAPSQGQQQGPPQGQPQGPPLGLQQGQPQNLQQRQFSGQGPLQPQGTGQQPGMPPNTQQQSQLGQPQAPQPQAPPQGLQQKPSLGSMRDQPPNFQPGQHDSTRQQTAFSAPQNGSPATSQPIQLQDPQAGRPQSPPTQQMQGPPPGSPGLQQQPQQGPVPNPQQRMSQPPGQQQGPQEGRPVPSGHGPNGPQFGQPGQQGPPGKQFPPGQQPPQGFQGQFRPQGPGFTGQFGPGGPGAPGGPPGPAIRPPTGNSTAPPGHQGIPQSATAPQQQTASRKASGFLGGLMSKLKGGDSDSHINQPAGQQPPQGQQFPNQQRPPSQSVSGRPFGQQMPGQPGQQPPAGFQQRRASEAGPMMGMGRGQLPPPGQLQPGQRQVSTSSIGLPIQGASPGPQPGQAIGQRPGMPPQQGSQTTVRPSGEFSRQNPLGSNPVTPSAGPQPDPLAPPKLQGSPQLAGRPSQERLSVAGLSTTPNRKPVGSAPVGPVGPDRSSAVSAHSVSTVTQPNSAISRPDGVHTDESSEAGESRSAASPAQSVPQFSSPDAVGLGRQPSLPTPSQTPAPQPPSPSAPSANQASPRPSEAETASASIADSQDAQHGTPQLQGTRMPGQQPGQGVTQPQSRPLGAPGQQQFMGQPQRHNTGSPAPSQQESSGISKFFGKKNVAPAGQAPGQAQPQEKKEKTSAKLLGAFRRQSKQADQQPASTQPPQQVPQGFQGQGRGQLPMNYQQQMNAQMQAQNQLGRGQMPPGQMPPHMQAGRGQGPPPPGQFPGGPPLMMAGRGQMPPGQIPPHMQAGRGQMPPQGPPQGYQQGPPQGFPQSQAGRGQPPLPQQQQFAGQQRIQTSGPSEQQYAPVPIPRGYEAVHGYGQPNMQAPTGYNIGRQYSGPAPPGWNPQWGPPPPHLMQQFTGQQQQQQAMMGQPPAGFQGSIPHGMQPQPQEQQQMPPNQVGRPEPVTAQSFQSGSTVGPSGHEQQPGQPIQPQGTGPVTMQNRMSPPLQDARSSPAQNPQNVQGPRPVLENKTLLMHEPSQPDNSPTISPQVSAPVAGVSPPINMNHNISPPAVEDQIQGRPHVGPIDTARADMVSPPNVPIPDSAATFSPVNPAADRLANPPLPTVSAPIESSHDTEAIQQHGKAPDSRRLSDIRLMASQSTEASERARSVSPSQDHHAQGQQLPPQQNGHSNLLAARAQNISAAQNGPSPQTPTSQQQGNNNPNMNINVVQANGHKPEDHHDYYDATPRVQPVAQQQDQQAQRQQEAHNSPTMNKGKAAAITGGLAAGGAVMGAAGVAAAVSDEDLSRNGALNGTNGDSSTGSSGTPANGIESPPLDREAEEKIVVEEAYELPAVNDNSEDLLVMSATSYPGQEWNPYGAGEFGDFEP